MAKSLLFSAEMSKNPHSVVEKISESGPLYRLSIPLIGKVWLTTSQHTASEILKNSDVFRVRKPNGRAIGLQWWMPKAIKILAHNMLSMDEPDHHRLRSIVEMAFRREAIMALEPRIEFIADKMVDKLFDADTEVDLVETFARHFPLAIICELLGLPDEDRQKFAKWASGFTRVDGLLGFFALIPNIRAMTRYLQTRIDNARDNGGDGLIAELVQLEHDGTKLNNDEMLAMVFLLLIAGHETTTHLISGGVLALLKNQDQKKWLLEDWSRIDIAVEELLRFVTPVQMSKPRYAYEDYKVGDVLIKRGELVSALLTASDYDNNIFDNPDQLRLNRKPNRHMAFGTGIHFCLGHQLARLEGKAAVKALFTRYPNLQLACSEDDIAWKKRIGLSALKALPVQSGN